MIRKQHSPLPGHVRVTFELPSCVWADQVFVTGEFNSWNEHALPMKQSRDGVWRAEVELLEGRIYQFRYLIDGRWQTDHHADGFSGNSYGSQNSLIDVTSAVFFPASILDNQSVGEPVASAAEAADGQRFDHHRSDYYRSGSRRERTARATPFAQEYNHAPAPPRPHAPARQQSLAHHCGVMGFGPS